MTLEEIANLETSDAKTDKGNHGYLAIYEELFAPYQDTDLPILEIGIGQGGSAKMWAGWFTKAVIHGIDIRPTPYLGPRIVAHHGHSADVEFVRSVAAYGPFAVVVDDGGHVGYEQETCFRELWPFVSPGGLYVIEDLHASYMPEYQPSAMPFLKSLADSVNRKGEFADIVALQFYPKLCVIAKKGSSIERLPEAFGVSDPED